MDDLLVVLLKVASVNDGEAKNVCEFIEITIFFDFIVRKYMEVSFQDKPLCQKIVLKIKRDHFREKKIKLCKQNFSLYSE